MKIIGISGRKQAGKNTVANFINGYTLKNLKMVEDFYVDDEGQLVIQTSDSSGQSGYGIFDPTRKDQAFVEYAEKSLWPFIKVYHFADPLKEMAIDLFGLSPENIYGNDDQKNAKTNIMWESMPDNHSNKQGRMTHREFLEHFGTKIIRKIRNNAWSEYTINKIVNEQSEIAIIPDVRFPNEVESIQKHGGIVLRLTRDLFNSDAEAETALDKDNYDWSQFDAVIENDNISLQDLCNQLTQFNRYWS